MPCADPRNPDRDGSADVWHGREFCGRSPIDRSPAMKPSPSKGKSKLGPMECQIWMTGGDAKMALLRRHPKNAAPKFATLIGAAGFSAAFLIFLRRLTLRILGIWGDFCYFHEKVD